MFMKDGTSFIPFCWTLCHIFITQPLLNIFLCKKKGTCFKGSTVFFFFIMKCFPIKFNSYLGFRSPTWQINNLKEYMFSKKILYAQCSCGCVQEKNLLQLAPFFFFCLIGVKPSLQVLYTSFVSLIVHFTLWDFRQLKL